MGQRHGYLYKNLFCIGAALLCLLLLLPSLWFFPVNAQPQSAVDTNREQELDVRIRDFFSALARRNSASAFDELFRSSPLGSPDANVHVDAVRRKVDDFRTLFGDIHSWDKYDTKQVGESILLIRYILKYDDHPVIWEFTFYRKPSAPTSLTAPSWVLIGLHFDTEMRNVFR